MPISPRVVVGGVVALAAALLAIAVPVIGEEKAAKPQAATPAPANAEGAEPPLEFELEIDGRKVEVALDRESTIDVDGKPRKARLTARPDRLFRAGGVSFRYPRQHAFRYERDAEAGFSTWSFDGDDNVLILTRYDQPIDEDDLRQSVVEGITSQYRDVEHKAENTTVSLGGTKRPATRLSVKLAGTALVQEVCAWRGEGKDGGCYSLIIQDSPAEDAPGKPSAETVRVLKLLDQTFKQDERK